MKNITSAELREISLTLLFVYLKLTNQIDWSWVWVISPTWVSILVSIILAMFRKREDDEK